MKNLFAFILCFFFINASIFAQFQQSFTTYLVVKCLDTQDGDGTDELEIHAWDSYDSNNHEGNKNTVELKLSKGQEKVIQIGQGPGPNQSVAKIDLWEGDTFSRARCWECNTAANKPCDKETKIIMTMEGATYQMLWYTEGYGNPKVDYTKFTKVKNY